jgi:rod shape-determining protein MreB
MLRSFMARALPGRRAQRHRSVICVPFSMTDLEERTVREAAELAGACYAVVVEKAMAAAIGAGLPVNDPSGSMLVDVGGGTTDVAVVALGSIVAGRSLPTGGNEMDAAVVGHLSRRFDLVLQPRSAEAVKIKMGSAYPLIPELHGEVWGRDLETGIRRSIITSTAEIRQAIAGPVAAITEAVTATIDELSPSRWAEVKGRGIVLCGGGSLLAGLAERLQAETGAAVRVAANPIHCVAIGAGRYLDAYADNVIEHLVPAS